MKLECKLFQRRETRVISGEYRYYVTTVISEMRDADTGGTVLPHMGIPYTNLFVLDAALLTPPGTPPESLLVSAGLSRVATPEDFSDNPPPLGPTIPTFLQLPRLYFPSAPNIDPTTPPTTLDPAATTLADVYVPDPARPNTEGTYNSNVLISYKLTLADADSHATEMRNAISVFLTRFNEIAAGFDTMSGGLPAGYQEFNF